jgi:hypothetical protein
MSPTFFSVLTRRAPVALAWAFAALLAACSAFRQPPPTTFKVTIANVTGESGVSTVISTGVAFTHSARFRMFQAGQPDQGLGLEGVAEDGYKWALDRSIRRRLEVLDQVIFDTPVGGTKPENIGAGKRYEFYIAASPAYPYLSLATMVGFTNDANLMLDTEGRSGYALFHPDGTPKSDEELKDAMAHWDVWDGGTEINEPNGLGPNQPDAPSGFNVGPPDQGLVQVYEDVGNPIDDVRQAFRVTIANIPGAPEGTLRVTIRNATDGAGLVRSALGPVLAVTHDPSLSLFDQGTPDRGEGLEPLAEDGSPDALIESLRKHPGYGSHLAAGPQGAGQPGPIPPGATTSFEVRLDPGHPMLSLAAMYMESNDAFLTLLNPFGASGLMLHGRSDEEIAPMVESALSFMETGTERNEPIGQGPNQGARQKSPDQGPPDRGTVRRWRKPSDPIIASAIATITITRADDVARDVRPRIPVSARGGPRPR